MKSDSHPIFKGLMRLTCLCIISFILPTTLLAQGAFTCEEATNIETGEHTADHTDAEEDQYYLFTNTTDQDKKLTVSSVGLTNLDTYLYIYDECDGKLLASNDDYSGRASQASILIAPQQQVVIRWGSQYINTPFTYNFSVELAELVAGDICDFPIEINESTTLQGVGPTPKWYKISSPIDGYLELKNDRSFWTYLHEECSDRYDAYYNDKITNIKVSKNTPIYLKLALNRYKIDVELSFKTLQPGVFCDSPLTAQAGQSINNSEKARTFYSYTPAADGQITINTEQEIMFRLLHSCSKYNSIYIDPSKQIRYDVFAGEALTIEANRDNKDVDFDWEIAFFDGNDLGPSCLNAIAVEHGTTINFPKDQVRQYYKISAPEESELKIDANGVEKLYIQVDQSCNNSGNYSSIPYYDQLDKGDYLIYVSLPSDTELTEDLPISFTLKEIEQEKTDTKGHCTDPIELLIGNNETPENTRRPYYQFTPTTDGILHFDSEQVNMVLTPKGTTCSSTSYILSHDILLASNQPIVISLDHISTATFDVEFEAQTNLSLDCNAPQPLLLDSMLIYGTNFTPQFHEYTAPSDGTLVFYNSSSVVIQEGPCDNLQNVLSRIPVTQGEKLTFMFTRSYLGTDKKIYVELREALAGDQCETAVAYNIGENVAKDEIFWSFTAPEEGFYEFSAASGSNKPEFSLYAAFYFDCGNGEARYNNQTVDHTYHLTDSEAVSDKVKIYIEKGEKITALSSSLAPNDIIIIEPTTVDPLESCQTALNVELGAPITLFDNDWKKNFIKYTASFTGEIEVEMLNDVGNRTFYVKTSCYNASSQKESFNTSSPFYVEEGNTYYFEVGRLADEDIVTLQINKVDEIYAPCQNSTPLLEKIYDIDKKGYYFEYVAPANGTVTIGSCNVSRNTYFDVEASTGSCESPTNYQEEKSSSSCIYGVNYSFAVSAGQTYYFNVYSYSNSETTTGKMKVEIDLENQPLKGKVFLSESTYPGDTLTATVEDINVSNYTGEWYRSGEPTGVTSNSVIINEEIMNANNKYVITSNEKDGILASKTIFIGMLDISRPDKPQTEQVRETSINLKEQPFMEYRLEGEGWQRSTEFPDLTEGETYNFYQRIYASAVSKRSDASEALAVVTRPLGADKPQIALLAYPNPTTNILNIEVANPSSVQLISMAGTVLIEQFVDAEGKINVSHLAPGLYIIRALDGENEFTGRIVIE